MRVSLLTTEFLLQRPCLGGSGPGGLLTVDVGVCGRGFALSPPTRFAMLKADAREESTGRGPTGAPEAGLAAAGAVAPGVGDLGEGLGPPALHVGVGLGVTLRREDAGDSDGDGGDVVVRFILSSQDRVEIRESVSSKKSVTKFACSVCFP